MSTSVSSVTKHFPSAQNGFQTTLASTISSGAATVPLNSVAGYTNGETAVMVVDPTSSTAKQTFTGVIDTAGVQLTGVIWTAGTNQTHAGGATVVDYATATHISMITKGLLRDHNQSGYHKTLNDDNGNEWIKQTSTASAVNEITVTNAATASSPSIAATGGDTNIDLKLTGKGTGKAYNDSISEWAFDFVVSGLVWSGDAYASTRVASMTAGFVYVSGVRQTVAAITSRTFNASKDTYMDVASNGIVTFTEVSNNAASPALSANNIRIAIIVTGATTIAAVGSVNQGQEDRVLPIASSIPYAVTDSLGNLICPRDPQRKTLGYRQITSLFATAATSATQVTGLTSPIIVPTGRKIEIIVASDFTQNSGANNTFVSIWDGTVGSGTLIRNATFSITSANVAYNVYAATVVTPSASSKTYNIGLHGAAGTSNLQASATAPAYVQIKLL